MKGKTLFLKAAVCLIGIPVLALCVYVLISIVKEVSSEGPPVYWLYPILIGMYLSTIPFYFALFQTFKILSYIDMNKAFSELSVKALKNIKRCATSISILYIAMMPFIYIMGDDGDAPGSILVGFVIIFASIVASVFSAVLEKLLKNAIDIKSENDLTI